MNRLHTKPELDPLDLDVLARLVRRHLSVDLPDHFIDDIIEQAARGNGPAEFIVGTWWESLSYESQARFWFASSAAHQHAPAFARLAALQPTDSDAHTPKPAAPAPEADLPTRRVS